MNIPTGSRKFVAPLLLFAGAAFVLPSAVQAGATDLAMEPLITIAPGAAVVRPNLFFILDNSGSMNWDYLSDWVVDSTWCKGGTGTASLYCCSNASGSNITSSSDTSTCLPQNSSGTNLNNGISNLRGMPPFHSHDFNSVYYNPAITYTPPNNSDGTSKTSYSGTGAVPWDGYGVQYSSSQTITLTSGYPDVEWCNGAANGTHSNCLRNDNYLLPGTVAGTSYTTMNPVTTGTGATSFATGNPASPTTASRSVGPYYYVMVPGEYCTTPKLTDCISATGQTTSGGRYYSYPARLRWCNNAAGRVAGEPGASSSNACQAIKNPTYQYPRYPTLAISAGTAATPTTGSITVGGNFGSSNCTGSGAGKCGYGPAASYCSGRTSVVTVTGITIGGTQALANIPFVYCNSGTNSTARNGLATALAANMTANGFSGSSSGSTVTVTSPVGATYNGASMSATVTTATLAYSQTSGGANATSGVYIPGSWKRTDIVSGGTFGNTCVSSAGVVTEVAGVCPSGSTTVIDRSDRGDCAAKPTCSYSEELSNFANWFAWYRSRIQMAKSSLSRAFVGLDQRNRVGFFTINSSSTSLVNIAPFDATQKSTWYSKLFAANPSGSTPLRVALANAGRIYAGKTSAISGATDPVQYSCQKNFTILSTDGYWNGGNGVQVNGTTAIGNEDSSGMVIPAPPLTGGITGPFSDTYTGTLADVAAYYYKTDLRQSVAPFSNCTGALGSGIDVCANNVTTTDTDKNTAQHMTTFTIGLGIDGVMKYRDDYTSTTTDTTDDYSAVHDHTTANPSQGVCPWQSSGSCNWPDPNTASSTETQERIDDLWHAAVNGHGKYYSAGNAAALTRGLNDALSNISSQAGGGAAATTSNPNVTTGDNFVFSSKFWTVDWTGEFYRQTLDPSSGVISNTNDWEAHTLLDAASWSSRHIYTFISGGGTPRNFQWSALNDASGSSTILCNPPGDEKDCFAASIISSGLSQWSSLSAADQTAAAGQSLVDYVRGDKSNEDTTSTIGLYRQRKHRLGDIVNSEAFYVGKYLFDYGYGTSNGYPAIGTARSYPTVYVAANDGMLHAFNAGPAGLAPNDANYGQERWAYIPSMAIKNLYHLADKNYAHRYFVDGSPAAGDVYDGSLWRTILVGGLAGGGAGYYALDITDQTAPKVLWEFRQKSGCTATAPSGSSRYSSSSSMTEDCDLGYSYGNPIITKTPAGTWVVVVTSGYNNYSNGDGKGYLYILNALTGVVMGKVSTGVGDTDIITSGHGPSGLGKINAWVDNALTDNTAKYVYGGDLFGNLWKFDLTGCTGASSCFPAKTLLFSAGSSKPITAKPELGEVVKINGQKKRVVFFPTGSLLGNADLAVTATQSFYGIWDSDTSSPTTLVTATASSGGTGRIGSVQSSVFETDTNLGWQLDFPAAGERGNTDPQLAFGTLVFSTNKPGSSDTCNPSGFTSWVWNIDYLSGGVVQLPNETNSHMATEYSGASTRPNVVVLPSGVVKSITRTSGQEVVNNVEEVRIKSGGSNVRRVTWRELLN